MGPPPGAIIATTLRHSPDMAVTPLSYDKRIQAQRGHLGAGCGSGSAKGVVRQ